MPDVKKCIGLYKFEKRYKERFANIIQPFIEMLTPLHYEDAQKKLVTRSLKVDQIDSMIKSGSFLVFDLSRPSPNVMYELGIGNALNKPKVLLISRQGFKQNWGAKKPFDLEGRELLIYESERDLIEKLHKSFWDAYYANSEDVKINWKTPLLVNSRQSKINIGKIKEVWCDESINGDCLVTFTAKIQSSSSKNPDLRLNIAGSQGSFPRITIIFPWENSENEKDQFECHFDFIKDPGTAIRIREESVCKNNIKEFTGYLYISKQKICFWANVFPDDLFGVYVEKETLDQKFNYKFPDSYFIGFSSTENTRGEISGLSIKKLSDPLLDNQILDEKDFIKPTATSSEHKNNLIASILHELKQFQSFLRHNSRLYSGSAYVLETRVIEETVSDQVKFISNQNVINALRDVREVITKLKMSVSIANSLPWGSTDPRMPSLISNWSANVEAGKRVNTTAYGLLIEEYSGTLPSELQDWSRV